MHEQVATKLVITSGNVYISRAVSMDGGNAVEVDAEILDAVGATPAVTVSLETSNDLQNWIHGDIGSITPDVPLLVTTGTIAAKYVRLTYALSSGTSAVVAAGIQSKML